MTNNTPTHYYNDGILFDPSDFIPSTKQDEQRRNYNINFTSGTRPFVVWFHRQIANGATRNNTIFRYAMILKDNGLLEEEIRDQLFAFNKTLGDPLTEQEINGTIMKTTRKKLNQ